MAEKLLRIIDNEIDMFESTATPEATKYERGERNGALSMLRHLKFVIMEMQRQEGKA